MLKHLIKHFNQINAWGMAAVLAFNTMLGLVPLMGLGLWVLNRLPVTAQGKHALPHWIISHGFGSIAPTAQQTMVRLIEHAGSLSAGGVLILVLSTVWMLWSIQQVFASISKRSVSWHHQLIKTLASALFVQIIALSLTMIISVQAMISRLAYHHNTLGWVAHHLWTLIPLAVNCTIFTVMFRWFAFKTIAWRQAFKGAVVTTLLLEVARWCVHYYWLHVPSYQVIYGALATIPIIMLWIYLAWLIIILGALLSHHWKS